MRTAKFASVLNGIMILNQELERIRKEVTEASFNVLLHLLSRGTQENHEILL
jgi:hypothetical protein